MRKIYLVMAFFSLLTLPTLAQRYLEEIFTDVEVTSGVTYGMNATVLYYSVFGEAVPEALVMDVYEPAGDVETNRPVILCFHTGNFLPYPLNGGTGGSRTDSSVVEICSRFARMGYVVASCDYRLGWNPLAPTQPERTWALLNAAYRGVQDCRTAVRYMRKSVAEMGNPYGVDPSKVAVWGQGTGGYIAFAAATLNNWMEDIDVIPKFNWDPAQSGTPMPMVIEFVNGNADATSVGVNPQNGDTLCYPNHEAYTSEFNVMVNMGGAMGDISWLEENSTPMISFHVPTDPFAPYNVGTVIVPTTNEQVVEVTGSYGVQEMANTYSNNTIFAGAETYPAGLPFTNAANQANNGFYGLYPFFRANNPYDSSPWDWWNPALVDSTNNADGLMTNPDMSATKARTFIDSIQGYAAPRIMCALDLAGSPCAVGVSEQISEVSVYPNPTQGLFMVNMKQGDIIQLIEVYDIMGKRVFTANPYNYQTAIDLSVCANGMYTLKVKGDHTTHSIRVQKM